jgi:hypothetical protein
MPKSGASQFERESELLLRAIDASFTDFTASMRRHQQDRPCFGNGDASDGASESTVEVQMSFALNGDLPIRGIADSNTAENILSAVLDHYLSVLFGHTLLDYFVEVGSYTFNIVSSSYVEVECSVTFKGNTDACSMTDWGSAVYSAFMDGKSRMNRYGILANFEALTFSVETSGSARVYANIALIAVAIMIIKLF